MGFDLFLRFIREAIRRHQVQRGGSEHPILSLELRAELFLTTSGRLPSEPPGTSCDSLGALVNQHYFNLRNEYDPCCCTERDSCGSILTSHHPAYTLTPPLCERASIGSLNHPLLQDLSLL